MPNEYKVPRTYSVYMSTHEKFKMACIEHNMGMSEVLDELMLKYIARNSVNSEVDVFGEDE